MKKRRMQVGDVVQLNPESGSYAGNYGGMLLVVTEMWGEGCMGYLLHTGDFLAVRSEGVAFLRPKWEDIEYVGRLTWVRKDAEKTNESSLV